jgi:hypothetical protein
MNRTYIFLAHNECPVDGSNCPYQLLRQSLGGTYARFGGDTSKE